MSSRASARSAEAPEHGRSTKSWRWAHKFFCNNAEMLEAVLQQLASGTDEKDDPVLGSDEECVHWYGEVTEDDLQAAIRRVKPGKQNEQLKFERKWK